MEKSHRSHPGMKNTTSQKFNTENSYYLFAFSGLRHAIASYNEDVPKESDRERLALLAEKLPTINFHEIFHQKLVQCGYRDISDEIDSKNDMGEKIHADQIRAKLFVWNPEDMELVEKSPLFVTEETKLLENSDMKLPMLKLDFKNMFYATCRAKLNFEINIRFDENPHKQFSKKFDSNEFMVKLKGDKLLFDSAGSRRYVF